jgi:hypothetical protein
MEHKLLFDTLVQILVSQLLLYGEEVVEEDEVVEVVQL